MQKIGILVAVCAGSVAIATGARGATVVTPSNMQGWVFDGNDDGVPPLTVSGALVNGPAAPPLGTGSANLKTGTNGAGAIRLATHAFDGALLSSITSLSYSTYVTSGNEPGHDVSPYLQLRLDYNNDGNEDDQIFFEPEYQHGYTANVPDQGNLVYGIWQTWDAAAGGWWSNQGSAGAGPGTDVKTLAQLIAANPQARLVNVGIGSLRIVAGFGAPTWNDFDGNVDALTVNATTYDFEAAAVGVPLPTAALGGMALMGAVGAGRRRAKVGGV